MGVDKSLPLTLDFSPLLDLFDLIGVVDTTVPILLDCWSGKIYLFMGCY